MEEEEERGGMFFIILFLYSSSKDRNYEIQWENFKIFVPFRLL